MKGKVIISGNVMGTALTSKSPISFWGGLNPLTGEIIDRRHDLSGSNVKGKIFIFPKGKGSSTSSAVLLESIKNKVAPAAIINLKVDAILALGAIIAEELGYPTVPMVILSPDDFKEINEGDHVSISSDGTVIVKPSTKKVNADSPKKNKEKSCE